MKKRIWIITCSLALAVCVAFLSSAIVHQPVISSAYESESSSEQVESEEMRHSYITNVIAGKTTDQLIEESNLIAVCELKEVSDAFQIEAVGGGVMNFTDYYFEVKEAMRGETPDNSNIVTVRIQGGIVDNWSVEMSDYYEFEYDKKYLLFLTHPGMGSGFNTEGDYYYITGSIQGIYPFEEEVSSPARSSYAVLENGMESAPIQLISLQEQIDTVNESVPPETNVNYKQFLENQKGNLDSGWITQEEYDNALAEAKQYANYIGDPPQYSGGE